MPKATKKSVNTSSETRKPEFINIGEHTEELAVKYRVLWTVVIAVGLVLVVSWFFFLRESIQKMTDDSSLEKLSGGISQALTEVTAKLKQGIQPASQPVAPDIAAAMQSAFANQIDSKKWPTHELPELGISMQYPSYLIKSAASGTVTLLSQVTADSQVSLFISKSAKKTSTSLTSWLKLNDYGNAAILPDDGDSQLLVAKLPISATSTAYFVTASATPAVYRIKTGGTAVSQKTFEDMIKSININNQL